MEKCIVKFVACEKCYYLDNGSEFKTLSDLSEYLGVCRTYIKESLRLSDRTQRPNQYGIKNIYSTKTKYKIATISYAKKHNLEIVKILKYDKKLEMSIKKTYTSVYNYNSGHYKSLNEIADKNRISIRLVYKLLTNKQITEERIYSYSYIIKKPANKKLAGKNIKQK